jgi:hypothetical protein
VMRTLSATLFLAFGFRSRFCLIRISRVFFTRTMFSMVFRVSFMARLLYEYSMLLFYNTIKMHIGNVAAAT